MEYGVKQYIYNVSYIVCSTMNFKITKTGANNTSKGSRNLFLYLVYVCLNDTVSEE